MLVTLISLVYVFVIYFVKKEPKMECMIETRFANFLFDMNRRFIIKKCGLQVKGRLSSFDENMIYGIFNNFMDARLNEYKENINLYKNIVNKETYISKDRQIRDRFIKHVDRAIKKECIFYMYHATYNLMKDIRISNNTSPPSYIWREPENLYFDSVFGYNVFVGTYIYRYHHMLYELYNDAKINPLIKKSGEFDDIKEILHNAFNKNNKMKRFICGRILNVIQEIAGLTYEQAMDVCKRNSLNDVETMVIHEILISFMPDSKEEQKKIYDISFNTVLNSYENGVYEFEIAMPGIDVADMDIFDMDGEFVVLIHRDGSFFKSGSYSFSSIFNGDIYYINKASYNNGVITIIFHKNKMTKRKISIF